MIVKFIPGVPFRQRDHFSWANPDVQRRVFPGVHKRICPIHGYQPFSNMIGNDHRLPNDIPSIDRWPYSVASDYLSPGRSGIGFLAPPTRSSKNHKLRCVFRLYREPTLPARCRKQGSRASARIDLRANNFPKLKRRTPTMVLYCCKPVTSGPEAWSGVQVPWPQKNPNLH